MKILQLPINIASHPIETALGLKAIGQEVKVFTYITRKGEVPKLPEHYLAKSLLHFKKRSLLFPFSFIKDTFVFIRYVIWADVIHWHYKAKVLPFGLDLWFIKLLRKPSLVEFAGTDIRIPEVDFKDNPVFKKYFGKDYDYADEESESNSRKVQHLFSKNNFVPLALEGMEQYILKEYFPFYYPTQIRFPVHSVKPKYPEPNPKKPYIVHTPSVTGAKGTRFVLAAIEELKQKYSFDFKLVHGLTREESLAEIERCDMFLDQFISGSLGMATVEAMSYGKPVFIYIKPSLLKIFSPDLPLINSSPTSLKDNIEVFLHYPGLMKMYGEKSRAYAEKNHDNIIWARRLLKIYEEETKRRKTVHRDE